MGHLYAPNICFAWLKLVLWSRIAYFAVMNLNVTFSPAVNAQCQSNMASMKQILRSCQWKNQIYFNWSGSFTCQKIYFAWLKLALWSRIACFPALNLEHFCRQLTLNASQTWLQSTDHCAHVPENVIQILIEMRRLNVQK